GMTDRQSRAPEPPPPGSGRVSGDLPLASSPDANPLLERAFRIPFHRIRAEHVEPGTRAALARAQARVDAMAEETGPCAYANTLGALDEITQELTETLSPIHHLLSVAETPELREAFNAVLPEIAAFWSRLPLNEGLWSRLKAFAGTPEARTLKGIRARHLEKTLREFRRAGADLPPERKARLEEARIELAQLQQKFSENVLDATAAYERHVTEAATLEGIPDGTLNRFRAAAAEKELEGWLLTLDFPSYDAVMKYAVDRDLREEIHRAYVGRCREGEHDNTGLIPRILTLRQEIAQTLGYRHFPDYRLEEAMARSGDRAVAFEEDLVRRTRPFWEKDVAMLRDFAGELGIGHLQPWDVAFVTEALRRARFDISEELLRPYFPLDAVMEGLFELVERVFGLAVTESPIEEVWHPDVRYYEVRDEEGTWIGSFYTDWLPRKEKRQGAWMNDFITGGPGEETPFKPHLGFIAGNFSPPSGDRPSLLNHREVRTVFHEFGHLLHHLTSRVEVPGRAGLNVAWDWVELPSQLMENWTWEKEALALFARHHETGETIPEELLERMLAARRFMGGWQQMRQLSFGTLDLALHGELAPRLSADPTPAPGAAVMAFAEEHLLPFSPDPVFARSHILTTFSHLFSGGYAAGYYSYLWSEVLDADAFSRFRAEGILNRDTGRAYVESILSRGDSADPEVLFRDFLGRDPNPAALLERNLGPSPA
ncbi:MAG: M3 family metallopeptidase, partial [Longimicrobiales bacterium]